MKAFMFSNTHEKLRPDEQYAIIHLKEYLTKYGTINLSDDELLNHWINWSNARCPHSMRGMLYVLPWECKESELERFMLFLSKLDKEVEFE